MSTHEVCKADSCEPVTKCQTPSYVPAADIVEFNDEFQIRADLPGVKPDGLDIQVENRVLTVEGKVEPRQGKDTQYLGREFGVGDFHRVFRLGENVDIANIGASLSDGVLVLKLPKKADSRRRTIEVKAN